MKRNAEQLIRSVTAALLGGVLLAGSSLWAQETNDASTNVVVVGTNAPAVAETPQDLVTGIEQTVTNEISNADAAISASRNRRGRDEAIVSIGSNAELKKGEFRDAVVVIGGDADIQGKVNDAAVVVGGNLTVSGEVGDAVVAVLGNVNLEDGAVVHGDVVSVGGKVNQSPGAKVGGTVQTVDFSALGLPHIEWVTDWIKQCVFKMRPLAPQVGWVWIVAGAFFLFYMLVAVVLPRPVQSCVDELTRRPATTFLLGLLTKLLVPIVFLILAVTGIGLIVIPFLFAALFFAAVIGKVALLQYLGDSIRRATGAANPFNPLVALFVGTLLVVVLYIIPVLGLLTFAFTSVWGLGVAVSAAFGGMKREMPVKPAPPAGPPGGAAPGSFAPAPMPVTGASGESAFTANMPTASPGETNPSAQAFAATAPLAAPNPIGVPEALAFPRAGFWERMGAAFLDIVLVGILIGVASNLPGVLGEPPLIFLVALAYFAGMWAWKGTTVGGIVLGLRVVRLDNQPVTFLVALVRGLAAAFSVFVLFLGFLWIAWDPEKQGWHDRIAGTVVIRLPRGTPLVVL